jgi:hypothetical protein
MRRPVATKMALQTAGRTEEARVHRGRWGEIALAKQTSMMWGNLVGADWFVFVEVGLDGSSLLDGDLTGHD